MAYLKNRDVNILSSINTFMLEHAEELTEDSRILQRRLELLLKRIERDKIKKREYTKLQLREYRKDPDKLEKIRKSNREAVARLRAKEKEKKQAKENNLNTGYSTKITEEDN